MADGQLNAYGADLALGRGVRDLEVDASAGSRHILERRSFTPVTTRTPYIWTPPATNAVA